MQINCRQGRSPPRWREGKAGGIALISHCGLVPQRADGRAARIGQPTHARARTSAYAAWSRRATHAFFFFVFCSGGSDTGLAAISDWQALANLCPVTDSPSVGSHSAAARLIPPPPSPATKRMLATRSCSACHAGGLLRLSCSRTARLRAAAVPTAASLLSAHASAWSPCRREGGMALAARRPARPRNSESLAHIEVDMRVGSAAQSAASE